MQRLHRRNQPPLDAHCCRNIHRRGKRVVGRLGHIHVIVGMYGRLASQRRTGKLTAAIRNYLVNIHVELCSAPRHPNVERKHFLVPPGQDLVARLHDQFVAGVVQPLSRMVRVRRGFLERGVRRDHLPGNQVLPDTEMLERALRLSAPEFVGGHVDFAEAVAFLAIVWHLGLASGFHLFLRFPSFLALMRTAMRRIETITLI